MRVRLPQDRRPRSYDVDGAYKRRFTMFMAIADVSVKSIYIRFDIYNESHDILTDRAVLRGGFAEVPTLSCTSLGWR